MGRIEPDSQEELVDYLALKSYKQLREIQSKVEAKEGQRQEKIVPHQFNYNASLIPETNFTGISEALEGELQWLDRRLREVYEWVGLQPKFQETISFLYS